MSAKGMVCAMLAGTALVLLVAPRSESHDAEPAPPEPHEAPWLTPEAATQIIGRGGGLGPLFDGVALGGPTPSPDVRARIARFARANHVAIDLEVVDGDVVAVRFGVTFGGCCGYEGADVLALRLNRPETFRCCGCVPSWIDDWTTTSDDGVYMRARVRVNRVDVRWERADTVQELIERADGLLGMDALSVGRAARDRWSELGAPHEYLLEVPYRLDPYAGDRQWDGLGFLIRADRGRIVDVTFGLRDIDDQTAKVLIATLRSRWGRPYAGAKRWTWRMSDRTATAEIDAWPRWITIRER